jgi:hypothetical protein
MVRLAAFLLLGAAFPSTAAPRHITGQKDGISFSYTGNLKPNGDLVLSGEYSNSGEPFTLRVAPSGHVEGSVGGETVSFDVQPEQQRKAAAELRVDDGSDLAEELAPETSDERGRQR